MAQAGTPAAAPRTLQDAVRATFTGLGGVLFERCRQEDAASGDRYTRSQQRLATRLDEVFAALATSHGATLARPVPAALLGFQPLLEAQAAQERPPTRAECQRLVADTDEMAGPGLPALVLELVQGQARALDEYARALDRLPPAAAPR